VARNRLGLALAAGRLLPARDGVGQIGRMATLSSMRGAHLGRAVLQALLAAARERGDRQMMLQAQASAVSFYEPLGFARHGAVFEEAGIPHQEMRRAP
jgi:predicted GNAT family N-acyltransferase